METTENNKLIAEFWGMELGDDKTMYYDDAENLFPPKPIDELEFNKCWKWLMPVIKKIRTITLNEMNFDEYEIWREDFELINPFNDSFNECYEYVLKFIKWYNKQN